jgi:hypothetical protein
MLIWDVRNQIRMCFSTSSDGAVDASGHRYSVAMGGRFLGLGPSYPSELVSDVGWKGKGGRKAATVTMLSGCC